ncbi:Phytolongin Phyl2.1 [Melia azedarach]|uniref:Phytolongin Phyl2.1 n=1 Tax=Melia azedarach TaxID=155640 RepID=A0ACC1YU61_MELAZ|nr:Phytolongin Phyl2.1 [Melia azedarach]
MISNPNQIFYACIAKGTIILGEFSSKEPGISETLAEQCIEKTPPHHSMFSHTVCGKIYTFLIDEPFTYFGIFDENLDKSESLWFLNRLKSVFEEVFERGSNLNLDNLTPHYLQVQFDAMFCEIMGLDLDFLSSSRSGSKDGRTSSVDSSKSRRMVLTPLLGKPSKGLKKKKRMSSDRDVINGDDKDVNVEKKVDVCDDVTMQKNAFCPGDRQKAKQIWKKHVWIVLGLDLMVCAILFGIWLWVCRGFQCIDG